MLAGAARRGDRAAFERLVVETSPQVYALVLRLVGDEHDARDVVQETYLRAFRSIGRFRSEAAVTTWLHRIAANCSATHLAKRRRPSDLPFDENLPLVDERPQLDLEHVASAADDRARLVAALDALPEPLRSVVVLHDVYDLPHEAIAIELGISRTAAKVRLHRARRRLRDSLYPPQVREAGSIEHDAVAPVPIAAAPIAAAPIAAATAPRAPSVGRPIVADQWSGAAGRGGRRRAEAAGATSSPARRGQAGRAVVAKATQPPGDGGHAGAL
jgi:RNA polymerase sigma-70 factor (ECF subfamily)